ncbi:hypothetical protein G9C85_13505 [Halorubellus sp. JP-L1]|uniref:HVO_A0114 family putative DNA-binding protein n=1 Tax=Halorubellus sp. JP-L1 TaxID=2715753 RepID=UPI00140BD8E1|nr:MarR family transcriptional regulator [Halorubellus sp. JP-L1]NHN42638.1 hypothetical protein [Halorubellus sp. JP-L1]
MTHDTLTIRIESPDEFFDDVETDLRQLDRGNGPEAKRTLSLPDEAALSRVLNTKNVELLRTIATESPASVRELSRLVDRDVKNVSTAVNELESLGLLDLEPDGRAKRPTVWYDGIDVELRLHSDETDDGSAGAVS